VRPPTVLEASCPGTARTGDTRQAAARPGPRHDWPWKARRVVARFGARTVPALIEALAAGEEPAIRRFAAESLGQLGPVAHGAGDALRHVAHHDEDATVRATAAAALQALEPPGSG
jgi:hypothetical protein